MYICTPLFLIKYIIPTKIRPPKYFIEMYLTHLLLFYKLILKYEVNNFYNDNIDKY